MDASCWVARKIFFSPAMASSSARTLDSRPTTKGVIMYGKMTTSRMGIIGRRLVSDFSFEVSMGVLAGDSNVAAPPQRISVSEQNFNSIVRPGRVRSGCVQPGNVRPDGGRVHPRLRVV